MTQRAFLRAITVSLGLILLMGYFSHQQLKNYTFYDISTSLTSEPIPLNNLSEIAIAFWPFLLISSLGVMLIVILSMLVIEVGAQRRKVQKKYNEALYIATQAQEYAYDLIKNANNDIERKRDTLNREQKAQIESNKIYLRNEKERILHEYKQEAYPIVLEQVNSALEEKKQALNEQHINNVETKTYLENWHTQQEQHYQSKKSQYQKIIDAKDKKLNRSKHQIQRLKTKVAHLEEQLMTEIWKKDEEYRLYRDID